MKTIRKTVNTDNRNDAFLINPMPYISIVEKNSYATTSKKSYEQ
jgi:hypothetical protein